jgi:hypothetical protein
MNAQDLLQSFWSLGSPWGVSAIVRGYNEMRRELWQPPAVKREVLRRRRQIERGQIATSNGLVA